MDPIRAEPGPLEARVLAIGGGFNPEPIPLVAEP